MHTSSDCIAHLAGALAKAQVELVNPPKTCTAALGGGQPGSGDNAYRYAPLSAGLDIVRRTLGKHDIAVVQATSMDRESGTVVLTTTLAHGSGQWIAARWPVCRVSDVAHPKLMGAALTYARRYSLFTLVRIAGEDDLDAPELASGEEQPENNEVVDLAAVGSGIRNKGPRPVRHRDRPSPASLHVRSAPLRQSRVRGRVVGPQHVRAESASDPAVDLAQVKDEAGLLRWALAALPHRNGLSDEARAALDAAFQARAEAVGAHAEVLIAFGGSRGQEPGSASAEMGGEHDTQASA